jgi:predicted dehydrogenase
MTSELRGAVVGFGRMGMTHYSILNSNPRVEFVSVCDPSSFIRKNVEKNFGIETFDDHETMLQQSEPDFIIVATPTGLHADCALQAIRRGTHVFMEKPLSLSEAEGRSLLDALQENQRINQVGYVVRFNDIFLAVKKLLVSGVLGDLVSFKAEVRGPTILRDIKKGWRATSKQGGGCLHDFASHAVDMTCYLFGTPASVTGSVLQKIYSTSVDDAVYSTLMYDNGAVGSLLANWSDPSYRKPTYNFEILCKGGKIVADLHQFKVYFRETPSTEEYHQGWNTVYVTDVAEPVRIYVRGYEFTRQLDYFVDRIIANDSTNICSFQDGYETDRVIEKIAADSGQRESTGG